MNKIYAAIAAIALTPSPAMGKIPAFQSMPPATHDHAIAYRPACEQLIPQQVNGMTQWGVTLSSGEFYVLGTLAPMPLPQAYASLDAQGLCKNGGDIVPIVKPHQAGFGERQTVTNIPVEGDAFPWLLVVGGLAGLALLTFVLWHLSKQGEDDEDYNNFIKGV